MTPLCFVLMPFGRKPAGDGRVVDLENTLLQAAGKHGGTCG